MTSEGLTYAAAGVDTEAGDKAVELMKDAVRRTQGPAVLGGVGGFAGLYDLSAFKSYRAPLLATSTDGVGTKVAIAQAMDKHDTIGFDLVGSEGGPAGVGVVETSEGGATLTSGRLTATVGRGAPFELTFRDGHREALYRSLSPLRFDVPLFYGHFDDLVWIVMFDRTAGLRLTHSPSGGGVNEPRRTTNPAWDFQLIIPAPEVMTEYALRVRTVLRPRCGREDILGEYEAWKNGK